MRPDRRGYDRIEYFYDPFALDPRHLIIVMCPVMQLTRLQHNWQHCRSWAVASLTLLACVVLQSYKARHCTRRARAAIIYRLRLRSFRLFYLLSFVAVPLAITGAGDGARNSAVLAFWHPSGFVTLFRHGFHVCQTWQGITGRKPLPGREPLPAEPEKRRERKRLFAN